MTDTSWTTSTSSIQTAPHMTLMGETDAQINDKLQVFCLDLELSTIVLTEFDGSEKELQSLCRELSEEIRLNFKLNRNIKVSYEKRIRDGFIDAHITINSDCSSAISPFRVSSLVSKYTECEYSYVRYSNHTLTLWG